MSSDSEIVRTSRQFPEVFGQLYDRHAASVHRYVRSRAGEQTADEVMAETFLVAFERRDAFDAERGEVSAWLLGIATVLLRKHARQEARQWRSQLAASGLGEAAIDAIDALSARLDAKLAVDRLREVLGRMPQRYREVLLLHAWGDLDYDGIAQALGIPPGTVASRLSRARGMLRSAIESGIAQEGEMGHGRVDTRARHAQ